MKDNRGITMVALVITVILLLIIAGISIGTGNNMIKRSELENLKTNMLLIEVKGKEYVENANFKLGTNFETAEDKDNRIADAKGELKGEEITDVSIFTDNLNLSAEKLAEDNTNYIYYYKLSVNDLNNIGLTNVISNQKDGWFIIKYDLRNDSVEVYNTKGFEDNDNNIHYSLTEIKEVEL